MRFNSSMESARTVVQFRILIRQQNRPGQSDRQTNRRTGVYIFCFFFLTFEVGRGTWVYSFFFQRRGTGFIFSFF
jgi:hypothetical protein